MPLAGSLQSTSRHRSRFGCDDAIVGLRTRTSLFTQRASEQTRPRPDDRHEIVALVAEDRRPNRRPILMEITRGMFCEFN